MRKIAALTILAALALAGAARADDDNDGSKVDCASTDLGFTDSSFEVDCADLSRSSISTEEGVAGTTAKKLFASRKTQGFTFLLAVDLSVRGTRVYFQREGLSEEIADKFTAVSVTDWVSGSEIAGFETATFTGGLKEGADLNCVAFRREVSRRYEGVGRKVVGISCTTQSGDQAQQALRSLKAPGS
jgi:hypothetical protein